MRKLWDIVLVSTVLHAFIENWGCKATVTPATPINEEQVSECLCDLTGNECDINCYCDPDCTQEDRNAFDEPEITRINEDFACVRKDLILTDNSEYQVTENTNEDVFCLWKDNFEDRNFFNTLPAIESLNLFDSYLSRYSSQVVAIAPEIAPSSYDAYKYGSEIFVVRSTNVVGELRTLSQGSFSRSCYDVNAINYLSETSSMCVDTTRDDDLQTFCENSESTFNLQNFFNNFKVVTDTSFFTQVNVSVSTNIASVYSTSTNLTTVFVRCIAIDEDSECDENLHNRDGNNTRIEQYLTTAFDTDTCSNLVKDVVYKIQYSGSVIQEIGLEVTLTSASISTDGSVSTVLRSFHVLFTNNLNVTGEARSGNPGFIRGYPIAKGSLQQDLAGVFSIVSAVNDSHLSIVKPGADRCADSDQVNVKFGYNTVSGCKIPVTLGDFATTDTCKALQNELLVALFGNDSVTTGPIDLYVPRFGNTEASQPGDWIQVNLEVEDPGSPTSGFCNLYSTVKLDIVYANVGYISSPQAKILGAKYTFKPQTHSFKCGPQCSSTATQELFGQIIVNFVDASEDSEGAIKKIPPVETDIPYDFFYPFFVNGYPQPLKLSLTAVALSSFLSVIFY